MTELLAFLGVAVVVIVTPGQDTALTVRNTLAGGRRAGFRTAAGVVAGQAGWALAASAGVAALIVASEPAFVALKLAGAAYLVYLGGQFSFGVLLGLGLVFCALTLTWLARTRSRSRGRATCCAGRGCDARSTR